MLVEGKPARLCFVLRSGERGKQLDPGNKGSRSIKVAAFPIYIAHNSARIQPTLHTSIAFVYSRSIRINSGALYQRVTTCPVISLVNGLVFHVVFTSLGGPLGAAATGSSFFSS